MSNDYDDFLFELLEYACSSGMLPSQFWEEEPADTLVFIESKQRQKQRDIYNGALVTASMFGVTLSNSFRSKGSRPIPFPKFEEVFEVEEEPKKKEISLLQKRINDLRAQFAGRYEVANNGSNR